MLSDNLQMFFASSVEEMFESPVIAQLGGVLMNSKYHKPVIQLFLALVDMKCSNSGLKFDSHLRGL